LTQGIQIIEGDVQGHRKDLNEYYEISSSIIREITDMKHEGKSTIDIFKVVSKNTKISPEMFAYILTEESLDKITYD
jgi:hypothetical protein